MAMKRTTVLLPESLHETLRQEAVRLGVTMSQLIRSKLSDSAGCTAAVQTDPLLEVTGIGRDGRLTAGIDEELYDI